MDLNKLREPFDPAKVHWRLDHVAEQAKRGRALCYLDARDVMDRLDEVCGPENWQTRIEVHGGRVLCSLGIKCGDEWVFKTDGSGDTQFEAEKGGISGAIKRAAVSWGVGRYLYDIEGPWVAVENKAKSGKPRWVIMPDEHERLRKLLPGSRIAENGHTDTPDPHPEIRDDPSGLEETPQSRGGDKQQKSPEERARELWKKISRANTPDELVELEVQRGDLIDALPEAIRKPLNEHFKGREAELKKEAA